MAIWHATVSLIENIPCGMEPLMDDISQAISVGSSWHPSLAIWGDRSGSYVEMFIDTRPIQVDFKFDLRAFDPNLAKLAAYIAHKHGMIIVDEDGCCVDNTPLGIVGAIAKSEAFQFTSNPAEYFGKLSAEQGDR